MTNQEKIAYLKQYIELEAEEKQLREELSRWRSKAEKTTATFSLVPGGGGDDRIQSAVDHICSLSNQLAETIDESLKIRQEISDSIEQINESRLRQLLRYRYMNGMTWEMIAVTMNYNYRWVLKLHGKALNKLDIERHIKSMVRLKCTN